jgi:hypothetical protein
VPGEVVVVSVTREELREFNRQKLIKRQAEKLRLAKQASPQMQTSCRFAPTLGAQLLAVRPSWRPARGASRPLSPDLSPRRRAAPPPRTAQAIAAVQAGQLRQLEWLARLPDAPVYSPTAEQWADPLAYIRSIQAEAAAYGICTIRAPVPPSTPGAAVRWPALASALDRARLAPRLPCHLSPAMHVTCHAMPTCAGPGTGRGRLQLHHPHPEPTRAGAAALGRG